MRILASLGILLFSCAIDARQCLQGTTNPTANMAAQAVRYRAVDYDSSGAVDIDDFFAFADSFGVQASLLRHPERYDLNDDGAVDGDDFFAFADCYGAQVPDETLAHVVHIAPGSMPHGGVDLSKLSSTLGCMFRQIESGESGGYYYSVVPAMDAWSAVAEIIVFADDTVSVRDLAHNSVTVAPPDSDGVEMVRLPLRDIPSLSLQQSVTFIQDVYDTVESAPPLVGDSQ